MEQHDCTEVLSKVFLALDGEMTTEEEKEFLEHLDKCNGCLEAFKAEESFKLFLKDKIAQKKISPMLVEKIRRQLSRQN